MKLCVFTDCSLNAIRQNFWVNIYLASIAAAVKVYVGQGIQTSRANFEDKHNYQANI